MKANGRSKFLTFVLDAWWLDYLVGISIFFIGWKSIHQDSFFDFLGSVGLERRLDLYTDLINISALLAGFLGLAFTSYLSWSSKGIATVKERGGNRLQRIWLFGIATPWVCTLLIWFAKIHDREEMHSTNFARWVVIAIVMPLIFSFLRILYLYVLLADVEAHPPKQTLRTSNEKFSPPTS